MSFAHLSKYDVTADAVDYVLPEVPGEMTLKVLPAGASNGPYFAAALRQSTKGNNKRRVTPEYLATERDTDKSMFVKYIIVGWANVVDDAGVAVPFSAEKVTELLAALPDWIFDDLRRFCLSTPNFVKADVDAKN